MAATRRLAAIMFTDIAGYTALTQRNESEALKLLEQHNRMLRPIFPTFRGKEVKAIGDSFLVEFESALEATSCAVEIQRFLNEYNTSAPDAQRIRIRIGVHLGDVVHSDGDVLGDAVNIASRMEPLADPGGICVSEQVFDQIRNKMSSPLVKLGPKDLKNVQFPIDVYKVVLPWEETGATQSGAGPDFSRRLAVLPFTNMSRDPEDEFFAEGLTEELITELSKLPGLRLIARTSVMRFKNYTKGVSEIGKELNVGTILEGSVRKAGNRIRITAQLIDARTEEHLWSDRYDRELTDIFAVQDEISRAVAEALNVQLLHPPLEGRQPTRNLGAYSLYLKGRTLWNKRALNALREALRCFEEARDVDPKYAQAYSGISDCYTILFDRNILPWSQSIPKAKSAAHQALLLNDSLADGHASLGLATYWEYDWVHCEHEFQRAIELNPSYASAHQWRFQVLEILGRTDEAERELGRAEEADPLSPVILRYSGYLAWVRGREGEAGRKWDRAEELEGEPEWIAADRARFYASKGLTSEAIRWLRRYEAATSDNPLRAVWLGYLYATLKMHQEAERHLERLLSAPKDTYVPPTAIAWTYAGLDDEERFFEWILRSADQHSVDPYNVISFPLIARWRNDPRYAELLRRTNVPA